MSKDQAGSLFNIIDADGLISKSRCSKLNAKDPMLSKLFWRSHTLNIMFISQVFKILLSRPTLSELEELFPDLSFFAKADSGIYTN